MQVYIQGTKKAINEKIKAGDPLQWAFQEFTPWGSDAKSWKDLKPGTVVKFWLKRDPSGTPIAKSYGQVKGNKIV